MNLALALAIRDLPANQGIMIHGSQQAGTIIELANPESLHSKQPVGIAVKTRVSYNTRTISDLRQSVGVPGPERPGVLMERAFASAGNQPKSSGKS